MHFSRDLCLQLDAALSRHWLETDGLGGYASSTLIQCATSRFHGLLVAPSQEQPKRHTFLSRFEETVSGDGQEFPISDARYGGAFGPGGHRFVDTCDFAQQPSFTYRIGHVTVVRDVQMVHGRPAVLVRYRVTGQRAPVTLQLRPFTPYRAANTLTFANDAIREQVDAHFNGIRLRPYDGLPELHLTMSREGGFDADPRWNRGFEYADDRARGYDSVEDQWSPGSLWARFDAGEELVIAASIGDPVMDPATEWASEEARRAADLTQRSDGVRGTLETAAEHFLYRTAEGRPGIIAGFPWFEEWGRDTLIALPGLTLARGQVDACGEILSGLRPFFRDGRLPNVFGTSPDDSDYKAVDPSLWYARAVRLYAQQVTTAEGEERLKNDLLPVMLEIATTHRHAESTALTCDTTGLLRTDNPEVATTWMDAVVDGRPVTPRHGCAVEINALWYELLDTLVLLLKRAKKRKGVKDWEAFRDKVGASFLERFWMPTKNRLADRVVDGVQDDTIRPNMVIAAALEASPLSLVQRHAIVEISRVELLTPRGLRTLSPRYLRYRGRFRGDVRARDDAYHQGTVWPWLLGFHVEAALRASPESPVVPTQLRSWLDGFEPHLSEHGVAQVSEVFDGDPPHRPGGCFAQAWSVAELLRAYALLDERTRP